MFTSFCLSQSFPNLKQKKYVFYLFAPAGLIVNIFNLLKAGVAGKLLLFRRC
jgi:hypothetical protein